MTAVGKTDALKLLAEAVELRGADWVDPYSDDEYPSCQYQHDGKPGCMVGMAYYLAGATVDQLNAMDNAMDGGGLIAEIRPCDLPFPTTDNAIAVFRAAQAVQDRGWTWGDALRRAREEASTLDDE